MTSISGIGLSALQSPLSRLQGAIEQRAAKASPTAAADTTSIKDRVESAIDAEVSSGKLNSEQAAKIKKAFDKAFEKARSTADAGAASGGASVTTSIAHGARDVVDGLASAVSGLRQAVKSGGLYGAGGSTVGKLGSLMVNAVA